MLPGPNAEFDEAQIANDGYVDNQEGYIEEEEEDPNIIGSGLGEDDDNDMDEEAFKEALERAKEAAEKLSMRPLSKK